MDQYRIGVDVGGTFTDLVLLRPDGTVVLEKTPTTPADQSDGVLAGLGRLADAEGLSLEELLHRTSSIVHGTTTGDNTMIQMSGAPTGLIVTEGFRDEIELRRCFTEDIWDPEPPGARADRPPARPARDPGAPHRRGRRRHAARRARVRATARDGSRLQHNLDRGRLPAFVHQPHAPRAPGRVP